MEEKNNINGEKMEEIMLPGFRFHPTDEELVGFYLKRKIQQRPPSIELIKQLDIYKYDPWNLPKLATGGEKEWYFYCPRDRKYRNSARPNRVTSAGFWKATGTDRPIYSSEGTNKCIGLKKSLVFYKGRAARGTKTDWMMHEFRLPTSTDQHHSIASKKSISKNIPVANDSWAICRIFKKPNSTAQRALSHSFVSPLPETTTPNNNSNIHKYQPFSTTMNTPFFSPLDHTPYNIRPNLNPMPTHHKLPMLSPGDITNFIFSPTHELITPPLAASRYFNGDLLSSIPGNYCSNPNNNNPDQRNGLGGSLDCSNGFSSSSSAGFGNNGLPLDQIMIGNYNGFMVKDSNLDNDHDHDNIQWETSIGSSTGFPSTTHLPSVGSNGLKEDLLWNSSSC